MNDMLKLTDDEGDSFATKAEMYYNRRPELVSHIEESYRMYRALAERYDNVTREIRLNVESRPYLHRDDGSEQNTPPLPCQKLSKPHPSPRAAGFDVFLGSGGTDLSSLSSSDSDFEAEEIKSESRMDANAWRRQKMIELENEVEILRVAHETTLELWKSDVAARDELNVKLMASIENLSTAKSDLEALVSEQDSAKSKLNKNIDELYDLISNLNGNLEKLQLENWNLTNTVENSQTINMELMKKINVLETEAEKHRITIFDIVEGKKEAIRQLCFSIDHYRDMYLALRRVLKSQLIIRSF